MSNKREVGNRELPFVFYTKGSSITDEELLKLNTLKSMVLQNLVTPKAFIFNAKLSDSHHELAIAAEGEVPEFLPKLPSVQAVLEGIVGTLAEGSILAGGAANEIPNPEIEKLNTEIEALSAVIATNSASSEAEVQLLREEADKLRAEVTTLREDAKTLRATIKKLNTENEALVKASEEAKQTANAAAEAEGNAKDELPWAKKK